jgi:hypothetical protein
MNSALNVIQDSNSNPEVSFSGDATPAAAHLITYLKKLKLQKIFRPL